LLTKKEKQMRYLTLPLAYFLIFGLVISAGVVSIPAIAQTTAATLTGTVVDRSGAVLPNVSIYIVDPSKNLQRQTTTNEVGFFILPLLEPGTYIVRALREGFRAIEISDVRLDANDRRELRIALEIGKVSETVTVSANVSAVNVSPAVETVVDRDFVQNLPLNGRSFQSLILFTPGVTVAPSSSLGQFDVNGERSTTNYFTVDGVSANIGVAASAGSDFSYVAGGNLPGLTALGGTNNLVSVDALEEYKIQTSSYSAEYGRQPGGQVQLVTRSGQNQFHGSAFEYLRNDAMDAANWFDGYDRLPKPELRQNQFGGTLSGPVAIPGLYQGRDHTFFFFSYEGQRLRLPQAANFLVPSLSMRQQSVSAILPLLNSFPIPTGPEITMSGVPSGAAPFSGWYSAPSNMDAASLRLDEVVNSKLVLFARYNYSPSNSAFELGAVSGIVTNPDKTQTLTVGATLSATPTLLNEFRFNYSINRSQSVCSMMDIGGAVPMTVSQLLPGYSGGGKELAWIFMLLGGNSLLPEVGTAAEGYQRQINAIDNVTWTRGPHQLKFGVDYRRMMPIYGPVDYQQSLFFLDNSDLSNGVVSAYSVQAQKGARPIFDNISLYGEDTWKISQRLSLDMGLRWELNPAPRDANGLKPPVIVGLDDLPTAHLGGPDAPFYKTFYTAFAPRVGVAYQLNKTPGREMVLRGGFGVYYDLGSSTAAAGFSGPPFVASTEGFSYPGNEALFPLSAALAQAPSFAPFTLPTSQTMYAENPDLRLPFSFHWNVALEQSLGRRQILTMSYVGSAARRQLMSQVLNETADFSFNGPKPNPNFGLIYYTTNGPTSDYNSLQVQYKVRMARRLQAMANYTWAHAIDEISEDTVAFGSALDRGNASFDVRHNFNSMLSFDVPKFSNLPVLRAVSRGWSVDSTFLAQTGQPIDIQMGSQFVSVAGTIFTERPDRVLGVPFWISDASKPGGRVINPAAFAAPPSVTVNGNTLYTRQGTLGRDVVYAPGFSEFNLAVRKTVKLGEKTNLDSKVEAFNVINHPEFGAYAAIWGNSIFGISQATLNESLSGNPLYQLGGPRSIQVSLRLHF